MSARSHLLARILLKRMDSLEAALLDDADPSEYGENLRREELVQEVLLTEVDMVDSGITNLVLAAMPRVMPGEESTLREVTELAQFLDKQLQLSGPGNDSDIDTLIARIDTPIGQQLARDEIGRHGLPTYGTNPSLPGRIIERLPDGTARVGRWLNGKFIPDPAAS